MSESDFAKQRVKFTSDGDQILGQSPINHEFTHSSFTETDLPLFQLAAAEHLKKDKSATLRKMTKP